MTSAFIGKQSFWESSPIVGYLTAARFHCMFSAFSEGENWKASMRILRTTSRKEKKDQCQWWSLNRNWCVSRTHFQLGEFESARWKQLVSNANAWFEGNDSHAGPPAPIEGHSDGQNGSAQCIPTREPRHSQVRVNARDPGLCDRRRKRREPTFGFEFQGIFTPNIFGAVRRGNSDNDHCTGRNQYIVDYGSIVARHRLR